MHQKAPFKPRGQGQKPPRIDQARLQDNEKPELGGLYRIHAGLTVDMDDPKNALHRSLFLHYLHARIKNDRRTNPNHTGWLRIISGINKDFALYGERKVTILWEGNPVIGVTSVHQVVDTKNLPPDVFVVGLITRRSPRLCEVIPIHAVPAPRKPQ